MTELERTMLCICCGTSVGLIVGSWLIIVKDAIMMIRERFNRKKTQ